MTELAAYFGVFADYVTVLGHRFIFLTDAVTVLANDVPVLKKLYESVRRLCHLSTESVTVVEDEVTVVADDNTIVADDMTIV